MTSARSQMVSRRQEREKIEAEIHKSRQGSVRSSSSSSRSGKNDKPPRI